MNLDSNRAITSKYFSKKSMDESLSDFQEVKQSYTGPKTTQKSSKSKVKRNTKRIKGQKDIRTALKGKKNELVSYAKEFDNVCKASGVDVDSEQLQLAVALSKSLQTESDSYETSQLLTTQERASKIRRTLQEYGFKVPETKIAPNKRKKSQKQSKLLSITAEERKQIISEKYSTILFNNLSAHKLYDNYESNYLDSPLYNLSTNILYESLKDNTVFYVENLVEKSTTFGSLLRNWSDIPGRPISPEVFHNNKMNFNDIECSQEEIDIVLSGSVKNAQNIIKNKQIDTVIPNLEPPIIIFDEVRELKCENRKIIENSDKSEPKILNTDNSGDKTKEDLIPSYRSCSPDIFDDEISSIMDNTNHTVILSQEYKTKVFTEDNFMELTECANVISQNSNKPLQLSQNTTKRKSNDFMEITECVLSSSQPITQNSDKIDLTQSPDFNKILDNENTANPTFIKTMEPKPEGNIDLTQSPKHVTVSHVSPDKEPNNKTTLCQEQIDLVDRITERSKHNIDLTQSCHNNYNMAVLAVPNKSLDTLDLTQSSNSSDELPFINLNEKQESLDDTIILDENDYLGDNDEVRCSIKPHIQNETLDLTQELKDVCNVEKYAEHVNNQSYFDEFVHEHSESADSDIEVNECCNIDLNRLEDKVENSEGDIDLTQDSDSSSENHLISVTPLKINNSSLGKKDDVSIDYDEIPNPDDSNHNTSETNVDSDKNENINIDNDIPTIDSNNDLISNSSQNTEFDISDKELDYSLHKSRHEIVNNFDFGGISVLDDVIEVKDLNKSVSDSNNCHENSLSEVNVETNGSLQKVSDSNNELNKHETVDVRTPNNSEFIIKTNDVTPILDYASMTTPQRNSELNKYGLKPFKRKRAIQLLTHLYNQTHPMIASCMTEEPSPSKRRREEASPQKKSPAKSLTHKTAKNASVQNSPRKKSDSPKSSIFKEDVCGYNIATDIPDIRNIECSPEDFVFQKREKAKVHSCRVPLHIAFHNYVSSRRELREAILKYEPLNIDIIHKELASYGHRYDPKDLLKFLDKKCITVKTADNNTRNNKR